MRLFQWGKQFHVYSPELDAEHRDLFRLGAELQDAVSSHAPQERVQELLRALRQHIEDHFSHEERLMRKMRYEAYAWHKGQHDGVRRKVEAFIQRIESGDADAPEEMLRCLAGWLRDHMLVTDRMMSARLRGYQRQQAVAR